MIKDIIRNWRTNRNDKYNKKLRAKNHNDSPTILSNNCIAGIIYHNLGLKFNSTTVNLFLTPYDFVKYVKHLDEYSRAELTESKDSGESYPVGLITTEHGTIRIDFQHYNTFREAHDKWKERTRRINKDNLFVILEEGINCSEVLLREFNMLPYENKIVITNGVKSWLENSFPMFIYGKGYKPGKILNFGPLNIASRRYLDHFDYVSFLNSESNGLDDQLKIVHLISTMRRDDMNFIKNMNLTCDAVIVNQFRETECSYTCEGSVKLYVYDTPEKGLSKSRNKLLNYAYGDISVITDDDVVYVEGYEKIIKNAYLNNPDYDIIVFHFSESSDFDTRPKFKKECDINLFNLSKISSVEITFRTDVIKKSNIKFDELIGLGTKYLAGEENAFIADALRKKLKVKVIPVTICSTFYEHNAMRVDRSPEEWDRYFIGIGGCYYRIYRKFSTPMSLAYIILKKNKLYPKISIAKAFKLMLRGKREYKTDKKENN